MIRIHESDAMTAVTLTPTVPISCPPCTMTIDLVSYIGLKVSRCSVTFSTFDPVRANQTIYIEAVKTPGSFSRVAQIMYSAVKQFYPGSPWVNYTVLPCPVCLCASHL